MELRTMLSAIGSTWLLAGCSTPPPIADGYDDEEPMMIAFSDGETYPARVGLIVTVAAEGPPELSLNVLAATPAGEVSPTVQTSVAPSDMALLTSHAHGDGVEVPYGNPDGVFSYYVDGVQVYRRPSTIRLTIDGATVRFHISMGEQVTYGRPAPTLAPTATADVWGRFAVSCFVPANDLGVGFVREDPTWSTPACASVRDTYGLNVLLDAQ